MRRTFTASRSPELGGRYHTDTPRMQRGHNETTMKRVQQIAWIHLFFLPLRPGIFITGCLREACTGYLPTLGTSVSLDAP